MAFISGKIKYPKIKHHNDFDIPKRQAVSWIYISDEINYPNGCCICDNTYRANDNYPRDVGVIFSGIIGMHDIKYQVSMNKCVMTCGRNKSLKFISDSRTEHFSQFMEFISWGDNYSNRCPIIWIIRLETRTSSDVNQKLFLMYFIFTAYLPRFAVIRKRCMGHFQER